MTPLQTAEVRAGEIRIRLSELAAVPELTDLVKIQGGTGHLAPRIHGHRAAHGCPANLRTGPDAD